MSYKNHVSIKFDGTNQKLFMEACREYFGNHGFCKDDEQICFIEGRFTSYVMSKWEYYKETIIEAPLRSHEEKLNKYIREQTIYERALNKWEAEENITRGTKPNKPAIIEPLSAETLKNCKPTMRILKKWLEETYKDRDAVVNTENLILLAAKSRKTPYTRVDNYYHSFMEMFHKIKYEEQPHPSQMITIFISGLKIEDRDFTINKLTDNMGRRSDVLADLENSMTILDSIERQKLQLSSNSENIELIMGTKNPYLPAVRDDPIADSNEGIDELVEQMSKLKIYMTNGGHIDNWNGSKAAVRFVKENKPQWFNQMPAGTHNEISTNSSTPSPAVSGGGGNFGPPRQQNERRCAYCDDNGTASDEPHDWVQKCHLLNTDRSGDPNWPCKMGQIKGRRTLTNLDETLPFPNRYRKGGVRGLLKEVTEGKVSLPELKKMMEDALLRLKPWESRPNNGAGSSFYGESINWGALLTNPGGLSGDAFINEEEETEEEAYQRFITEEDMFDDDYEEDEKELTCKYYHYAHEIHTTQKCTEDEEYQIYCDEYDCEFEVEEQQVNPKEEEIKQKDEIKSSSHCTMIESKLNNRYSVLAEVGEPEEHFLSEAEEYQIYCDEYDCEYEDEEKYPEFNKELIITSDAEDGSKLSSHCTVLDSEINRSVKINSTVSLYTVFKPVTFELNGPYHLEVTPGCYILLSEAFKDITEMRISDDEAFEAWEEVHQENEGETIKVTLDEIVAEVRRIRILAAIKRKESEELEEDEGVKKSKAKEGVIPSSARPEVVIPVVPRKIAVPVKPSIKIKVHEDVEMSDKDIKKTLDAKEAKPKTLPKFKYSQKGPLTEIDTEKLMDKIFGESGPITLSVDELLSLSPLCQKRLHNTIKTWKIPTEAELESVAKKNEIPLKTTVNIAKDIFKIFSLGDDDVFNINYKLLSSGGDTSNLPSSVVNMMKWNAQSLTSTDKEKVARTMSKIHNYTTVTSPRDPTFWSAKEFNHTKNNSLVGSLATIRQPFTRDLQYSTCGSPHFKNLKFQEGFIVKAALIDSGAELVVCSFNLAMESTTRDGDIDSKVTMVMWDVNGGNSKMYGIIKKAKISPTDDFEYEQCCWVAPEMNKSAAALILGMPFVMKSQLQLIPDLKGNMFARVMHPKSKENRANFRVHDWDSDRNHLYKDLTKKTNELEDFSKLDGEIIDIENNEVKFLRKIAGFSCSIHSGYNSSDSASFFEADFQ